jgi:hypothetical protein
VTDDKTFSYYVTKDADAAFIGAANPAAVLELVARVRQLEAGLKEACDYLDAFQGDHGYSLDLIARLRGLANP